MAQMFNTLKVPKTTVKIVNRLGPASADIKTRHRPLEFTPLLVLHKRTALANARPLKRLTIFVKKELSWRDGSNKKTS